MNDLQHIEFKRLVLGENPRIPSMEHIEELADDIEANGWQEPCTGLLNEKTQEVRILRGTRRTKANGMILERNPGRFLELYPDNAVPVFVLTELSEDEIVDTIIDHGQIQGLRDPMELQLAANMLFRVGKTERMVVTKLSGLLDIHTPMKSDVRKEWLEKLEGVKIARSAEKFDWALQLQNEAEIFQFNNRRGKIQNIHNAYRCPEVVMQALWLKATGEYHVDTSSDLQKTMPRTLTYAHVASLYKAFKEDLKGDEEGLVTKAQPGELFWAKWEEVGKKIQEAAKEKADGKTRAKAMAAGDMMKDVTEAVWSSKAFRALSRYHAGEKDAISKDVLQEMDRLVASAEIVADGDPDLWASVVQTSDAIIKERVAATREKAAAKPATPKRKKIRK
jgi:hypothetical protein